ncbi:MAG: ATP phosphoribosyltransferase regulatory subunit, partial [Mariprofundaceae bacterium]
MESVLRPIVGLDDAFGQRTRQLRRLQSKLMDIFYQSEYEEVIPPLLERPESLSTGAGKFLAGQTIMFSDPAGEGLLAIRPDMTPQMARIAATRLRDLAVPRLCYSGQVMVARPDSLSGSRQQWQTGIELLGIAGEEADMEVMHLAALCLHVVNFNNPVIQVGHTGLLKALVADSDISLNSWASVLRLRSPEDMQQKLAHTSLPAASKQALMDMASGLADEDWIRQIRADLPVGFQKASAQ